MCYIIVVVKLLKDLQYSLNVATEEQQYQPKS